VSPGLARAPLPHGSRAPLGSICALFVRAAVQPSAGRGAAHLGRRAPLPHSSRGPRGSARAPFGRAAVQPSVGRGAAHLGWRVPLPYSGRGPSAGCFLTQAMRTW
jgi:hypothetical protein